ncbi:alpha/beta fold hydrolase [Corynebacterium glyciniphilum]|uniref:alpha/beta fold hydrolase n=1 Tax=Corynebacterium glyciniphilum TaxID=1404244 RepID=UPI0023540714
MSSPSCVAVAMPDGSTSPVLLFPGATRPLVMMWPGLGMGAHYYRPIAEALSERGFPVAVGELRGQGRSTAVARRNQQWGYHHLASQDYPRSIRGAKKALGLASDHPTVLLTHSMGGQIGALFLARPEARELNVIGMMGVGSGSPYFRTFSNPERSRLRYGGYLMQGVSKILGHWPDGALDVTNYGRQSDVHLSEWARFGRSNTLTKLRDADQDYMASMRSIGVPVLLTRFSNDSYCTVESCEALARLVPAQVEELPGTLGHNRWAREPQDVTDRLDAFVAAL